MAYTTPVKSSAPPPPPPPPVNATATGVSAPTDPSIASGASDLGALYGGTQTLALDTPTGVSPTTAMMVPTDSALADMFKWLLAWGVFIFVLVMLDRTRLGHAVMYYALLLMLVFVAVTEYKWFAQVLAPLGTLTAQSGGAQANDAPSGAVPPDPGGGGTPDHMPPES